MIKNSKTEIISTSVVLIVLVSFFLSIPFTSKAQNVQKLSNCINKSCITKPSDLAISLDGTFFLIVDSSSNPYVRKVALTPEGIGNETIIPLSNTSGQLSTFQIGISRNNKKAFVFGIKNVGTETKPLVRSDQNVTHKISFQGTDCRCISGTYFDGTSCVSGTLDCSNTVSDQVCSCDNLSFLNSCIAMANGVKKFTKGTCGSGSTFSCSSDSQCPLGTCPNGDTFTRFTCTSSGSAMCTLVSFSSDPCSQSVSSNCRCSSGTYFDGTNCVSGKLDCLNILSDSVCSCDKLNFLNSCIAMANGVRKFTKGACSSDSGLSCTSDTQCTIGECSNGISYKRFSCTDGKCKSIEFSTDPCLSSSSDLSINNIIHVIDLINNSVSLITPTFTGKMSGDVISLSTVSFLDANGEKLIAGNDDSETPKLLTFDSKTGEVEKEIEIKGIAKSIEFSPTLNKAVVTFKDELSQSVGIFNTQTKDLKKFDTPSSLFFKIDEFLNMVDFNLSGNKAVVSSLGGLHVLHVLNLKDDKLTIRILDKDAQGQTFSTISPDSSIAISVANDDELNGIVVYKVDASNVKVLKIIKTVGFNDNSRALDVLITPDNNKILILVKKDNEKKLKVLGLKDLSTLCEVSLSNDTEGSFLASDPYGRYLVTPNLKENSISFVSDLKVGPVFKDINPSKLPKEKGNTFTINGFIDPTIFSDNVKVCFRNEKLCASSVSVKDEGMTITGTTPRFSSSFLGDLILITEKKTLDSTQAQCLDVIETKSVYKKAVKFE